MRISVTFFNEYWAFPKASMRERWSACRQASRCSLPHNAVELPFNYFDETSYQRAFTYQKVLDLASRVPRPRGLARVRRRHGRCRRLSQRRRDHRPQGRLHALRSTGCTGI